MISSLRIYFIIAISIPFLGGCLDLAPSPIERKIRMESLAQAAGWRKTVIKTPHFDLTAFLQAPRSDKDKTLTIYIEGDGLSWLSKTIPSQDPTPVKPVGLMLALKHPDPPAAYIARPCQAGQTRNCDKRYWTGARFSSEVLDAIHQTVDTLKEHFKAKKLCLVGYSGGGAVATLIAARRCDVSKLVTIAGNLNHKIWTNHHKVSSLNESLNPADIWQQTLKIPQFHFVGTEDKIVPPFVVESFSNQFPEDRKPVIFFVAGVDHSCCWENHWPELYMKLK